MIDKHYKSASDMIRDLTDDAEVVGAVDEAINRQRILRQLMAMRAVRGLSQAELGKMIGSTQGRISKIESSADDDLKYGDLRQYAEAVGCKLRCDVRPEDLTAVDEVKCLGVAVHNRLTRMTELAKEDESITTGVAQFFFEAFINFSAMIGNAAKALPKNEDGTARIQVSFGVKAEEKKQNPEGPKYPPEVNCMLEKSAS